MTPLNKKNIIKYFGTIEDFLLTSMSSQLGSLTFINEGSTKRKEILAKFLDLELFDKKYKNAKDDAAELKAKIKLLENTDYDTELKKYKEELFANEITTLKRKNKCECLKGDIHIAHKKIKELEDKIKSAPTEIINIVEIRNQIDAKQNSIQNYQEEIKNKKSENQINKKKRYLITDITL